MVQELPPNAVNLLVSAFRKGQRSADLCILFNVSCTEWDKIKLDIYKAYVRWIDKTQPSESECRIGWMRPEFKGAQWIPFGAGYMMTSLDYYTTVYRSKEGKIISDGHL